MWNVFSPLVDADSGSFTLAELDHTDDTFFDLNRNTTPLDDQGKTKWDKLHVGSPGGDGLLLSGSCRKANSGASSKSRHHVGPT